jgi:hypothetical protein
MIESNLQGAGPALLGTRSTSELVTQDGDIVELARLSLAQGTMLSHVKQVLNYELRSQEFMPAAIATLFPSSQPQKHRNSTLLSISRFFILIMALKMEVLLQFRDLSLYSPGFILLADLALGVVLFACQKFIFTTLDPREPRKVKAKIPFVGHLFPPLVSQAGYLKKLR